jgi:hypothetical protein
MHTHTGICGKCDLLERSNVYLSVYLLYSSSFRVELVLFLIENNNYMSS